MEKSNTRVLFLDRDGVINKDFGYISSIENFEFEEGIIPFLLTLKHNGFIFFIITNQSGIGRGLFSNEDYDELTNWYIEMLKKSNIEIQEIKTCPHKPDDNCECRKPKSKMILDLIEKYNLNKQLCFMVGDKHSDLQAAVGAGIRGFTKTPQVSFEYIQSKIFEKLNR